MWSKKLRFPESIKSPTTGDITAIMHGVVFNRKGNLSRFQKFNVQAHILSLKYKLLAAKGSVSDCNMTRARSIFAWLALQLFLSRQVHTSLPQLLRPSWPGDRGKHLLSCFWTLKQIFSSIRRSRSHYSSFWVKDKFTQHRNPSVIPTQHQPEANACLSVFGIWSGYLRRSVPILLTF